MLMIVRRAPAARLPTLMVCWGLLSGSARTFFNGFSRHCALSELEKLALGLCVLTWSFLFSQVVKKSHPAQCQDAWSSARFEDEGGRALLQVVE